MERRDGVIVMWVCGGVDGFDVGVYEVSVVIWLGCVFIFGVIVGCGD